MTDQNLPEGQSPIKQPDGIGLDDFRALDQIIRPYFEGQWKNELEKTKLENEFELKVMETESKHYKWLMIGIFGIVFIVFVLAFYLFATDRNDYAMQIIVGIVIVIMTFIAGYGLSALKRSAGSEDQ